MKRSILGAAVALSLLAGPAGAAVTLNSEGLGQGLLFPFFTTQNGQTTLLNVLNQSSDGKALKVRILEGYASAETLTFNLYLPPYGRWSAALALPQPGEHVAALIGGGVQGCSIPQLATSEALRTFAFDGDGGPQTPARTQRGYVEIVEMGTLAPDLTSSVFGAIEPAWAGVKPACDLLLNRMQAGGTWDLAPNADLSAPSGGLRGDAVLLDSAEGTSFGYPALAFEGLSSVPRQYKLQGQGADVLGPRLVDIPVGPEGDIRVSLDDGDDSQASLRYGPSQGHDAVAALLASNSAQGVYNIHPDVAARSEWVFSFPTRVDQRRAADAPVRLHDCVPLGVRARTQNGVPQDPSLDAPTEIETCGNVSALQVYSAEGITFEAPPELFGFDSNRAPIVFSESTSNDGDDDAAIFVTLGNAVGNVEFDFVHMPVIGGRRTKPDLDGKCVDGAPVWVWQLQTYDNANAQPGRVSTFPEARVASRNVRVLDECPSTEF